MSALWAAAPALAACVLAEAEKSSPPLPPATFKIVAIGDTGERNLTLYRNARGVNRAFEKGKADSALVFLGDNFYKHGLSDSSSDDRDRQFDNIYGLFGRSVGKLDQKEGVYDWKLSDTRKPPRYWPDAVVGRIHAVAGNHDYYSESTSKDSFRIAALLPVGFSTSGNEYAATRKEWTYHYGEPGEACWPIAPQDGGKEGVQAIFLDSAILVRGEAEPPPSHRTVNGRCWSDEGSAQDCLSYDFRMRIKAVLKKLLQDRRGENIWRVMFAHHPLRTVGEHAGARWRRQPSGAGGEVRMVDLCSRVHQPLDWAKNEIDPEDYCTEGWREYRELVLKTIEEAGVTIDVFVGGHDHSLQLMSREAVQHLNQLRPGGPRLHIVSGAGAKVSAVAASDGERVFTAQETNPKHEGKSMPGWVELLFAPHELKVSFFSGSSPIKGGINDSPLRILPAEEGKP